MRFIFLIAQLCCISLCFSQTRLEFKIISITRTENKSKTNFTYNINYTVKNISANEISFFLNKNKMVCNAYGSLSNAVIYRFFKDDVIIDAPIFNKPKELNAIEKEKRDAEMKIKADSLMKEVQSYKNTAEFSLNYNRKRLLSEIITLKPGEICTMHYALNWDKLRNISYMDTEYYLDENSKYYLDFSIYLLKKPFEKYFIGEDKKRIIDNTNFIEGNYTSEKFELFLN